MGASQSAPDSASNGPGAKKSYYELLSVSRQAGDDEIKKAYRRKALELHPDRNYGNEQEATAIFAEVQAAYEVLSDPQERAWYDSHESAVLRGDDIDAEHDAPTYENVRATSADDLARLVRRFNSSVQFSDAPSGFFGFVRETFEQLAKEEEAAARSEGLDNWPDYPSFGHKDDAYDDVVKRFYSAWQSFSTVKSFAWKDRYRLSEAPDRWYRRRMEQENKKYRQDGIREFNDAVRSLVAFIRKRDPRYVPSTQTEEERQKILRDAAASQAARARAANEAKMNDEVPAWARSQEPDPLAEMEGTFDDESEAEEVFECVACNKIFKSERQWEAHEKSKKHQRAVSALQKKMRKDDARIGSGATSGVATPEVDEDYLEDEEVMDDIAAEVEDAQARANGRTGHATNEEGDSDSDAHDETEVAASEGVKPTESTRNLADEAENEASGSDSEDSDDADISTIQARLHSTSLHTSDDTPASTAPGSDNEDASQPTKKLGKAAQKRAKKAAAAAAAAVAASGEPAAATNKCAGCDAAFPTKTRLFQHLKDHPKHAALKPASGGVGGKKRKGKK